MDQNGLILVKLWIFNFNKSRPKKIQKLKRSMREKNQGCSEQSFIIIINIYNISSYKDIYYGDTLPFLF